MISLAWHLLRPSSHPSWTFFRRSLYFQLHFAFQCFTSKIDCFVNFELCDVGRCTCVWTVKNTYFQAYTNNLKVCLSTEIKWYWGRTYSSFPYNFTVAILLLITPRYHDKLWESNPYLRIPTGVMWMTSAFSTVLHWKMSPLWQCARFRSWKRQVLSIDLEYAWTWHMWTFNCRIIICPKHWPPACLRSWTETTDFSGEPAFVGDENILCEYHLRAQSTPVKKIPSIFKGGMVEIAPIRFLFAQIWVRRRSIVDAPGPTNFFACFQLYLSFFPSDINFQF